MRRPTATRLLLPRSDRRASSILQSPTTTFSRASAASRASRRLATACVAGAQDERGDLRPASQRHGPSQPRHRRRRAARQGHRAVRGVAGNDSPRRQRPDVALRLGQTCLRSSRLSTATPAYRRALADARGGRPGRRAPLTAAASPPIGHDFWGAGPGDTSSGTPCPENLYRAYLLTAIRSSRSSPTSGATRTIGGNLRKPTNDRMSYRSTPTVTSTRSAAPPWPTLVTGDERYLQICVNAYDFLQRTQCYATGGYGPDERFMRPDGSWGGRSSLRRSRRDPLRHLGGLQALALPDGVHRRGPLRRLDRDPALQRRWAPPCRPSRTARPTTTATTASPAG